MPTKKLKHAARSRRRARGRPTLADAPAIERNLLGVALRQFVKDGYGATSMNTIARAARVSKTTLYSRYSSKDELFRAIMREQIDRIAGLMTPQLHDDHADLESGLRAYANSMIDLSLRGDLLHVNRLIYSESHRFPELGAAAAERTDVGVAQITDFIQLRAAMDGIPCRDPVTVAQVFIHLIRGWYVNVMLTNRPVSATQREDWVERAVRTLIGSRRDW